MIKRNQPVVVHIKSQGPSLAVSQSLQLLTPFLFPSRLSLFSARLTSCLRLVQAGCFGVEGYKLKA